MPQQLEDRVYTLDDSEQCISIQAATAEELEEDDKYSSLLFGKYDKYFHNGDGNYEKLYRIAKLILPTALYITWRGFIDFQVEPGSPCITNKKVAEYTNKNVRTIELNMQRLRQAGFVRTQHVLRDENWVVEKNFSGMYQAIIAYMQWEKSSAYMPPTREYFEVDGVDKDVCSKVLHFNNYRRVLHNKRPGPKRKKVYPEEQAFIDGVFRELTTVQDSPSGRQDVEPVNIHLESTSILSEKTGIQPAEASPQEEKVSISDAATVALLEKCIAVERADMQHIEPARQIVAAVPQVEMSNTEVVVVEAQAKTKGTQPMVEKPLSEERKIQSEVLPVETEEIRSQVEPIKQKPDAPRELEVRPEQDVEEMKNNIMKEYQRISKEENQEAAMQWISMQNLEWMQPQDWDLMFEQNDELKQAEDGMKQKEENVVEQESACETESEHAVQEKCDDGEEEDIDPIKEFDKFMDYMISERRYHMKLMNDWYGYLHKLYDAYGRWAVDTNLIKCPARNQPKVPFRRFLKSDSTYRCALYPCNENHMTEEFLADLNDFLAFREEIYNNTEIWESNNMWLSDKHGFNKVNQAYLDRLSPEEIKRLKIDVFEPEPEVPAKQTKEKYLSEQRRLRDQNNKVQENQKPPN